MARLIRMVLEVHGTRADRDKGYDRALEIARREGTDVKIRKVGDKRIELVGPREVVDGMMKKVPN